MRLGKESRTGNDICGLADIVSRKQVDLDLALSFHNLVSVGKARWFYDG